MSKVAKYDVVSYYDSNSTGMSVGCTPTSGVLKFQWSLELLADNFMDIQGNYGQSGSGKYNWFCYDSSNHRFHLQQYSDWQFCYSSVTNVTTGTVYNVEGIFAATGMSITVNGTADTASGSAAGSRDFWLFDNGQGSDSANVRTYSLKVWDNTTLIGDFLPVSRKSDNLKGLWNQVNNEVYYPGGHEAFYDEVPYAQRDGEYPFIDTLPETLTPILDPTDGTTPTSIMIQESGKYPKLPDLNLIPISAPYPFSMMVQESGKYPKVGGLQSPDTGAFNHTLLTSVTVPQSLLSVGKYSFTESNITAITLPNSCTYYSTSFPDGCTVTGGQLIND